MREFFGLSERQTEQGHPGSGTPVDVPHPRTVHSITNTCHEEESLTDRETALDSQLSKYCFVLSGTIRTIRAAHITMGVEISQYNREFAR